MTNRKEKTNKQDVKRFVTKVAKFVKANVGTVMSLCLFTLFLYLSLVLLALVIRPDLVNTLFSGTVYTIVRIIIIVVVVYTSIVAIDFLVNCILVKLPTDILTNVRNDFLLRMNYMSMRANTNAVSGIFLRLFDVAAFSPNIINSPTVNFLVAFISLFGAVLILLIKHIFLWVFRTFLQPILHLFLRDKVKPRQEQVTNRIKTAYHDKVEKPIKNEIKQRKEKREK